MIDIFSDISRITNVAEGHAETKRRQQSSACGIMAITSAFQADDVGSIPIGRSLKHPSRVFFFFPQTPKNGRGEKSSPVHYIAHINPI